jgi:hypothetical protein
MEKNLVEGRMKNAMMKFLLFFLMILFASSFAAALSWIGNDMVYNASEDIVYAHNLSANISSPAEDMSFSVDTQNTVSLWNDVAINISTISSWIFVQNSSTGLFIINATLDNQTGKFRIPLKVTYDSGTQGQTASFNFTVYAVNDAPVFTTIQPEYNSSENTAFSRFINASDEEHHFPLSFFINFTGCEKATWSTRTNCTLFNSINSSNISMLINFTPSHNDVGKYYMNVSVHDSGENYNCSSGYCAVNYSMNMTTYYSSIVIFDVFSILDVNISACNNSILYENQTFNCTINISTKGDSDHLSVLGNSSLRNYATPNYVNRSWFYPSSSPSAVNFSTSIFVNTTPQKKEVGNWTINFTVIDLDSGENKTVQIYTFVNRDVNSRVSLGEIADMTVYENRTIYVNASDDDLMIPDKTVYNESLAFFSNTSWVSVSSFSTPSGGNYTSARINIDYNSAYSAQGAGNYTVRINVSDSSGNYAERNFTIQLLGDSPPIWNSTMQDTFVIYENNNTYLNLTKNVSDADNDAISFSYSNDTSFPSFNLNASTGIINFNASDADVGQHILMIDASDGKLTTPRSFNFTIYNLNENPLIEDISSQTATEDLTKDIVMYIEDEDLKVPQDQAAFYNESFNVNLTIEGVNSSLFNFVLFERLYSSNKSRYVATFTPRKADVGSYNVSINITDAGNLSYKLNFTLIISSINHAPVMEDIPNQTSSRGMGFYLRANATDAEDGVSSSENLNFTFSYNFLNGTSFLNSTKFNATMGEINLTFNSSQDGVYRINMTVNDSANAQDSKNFWVFVYGVPNITLPSSSQTFLFQEGNISNLTFEGNHSVKDNLSYYFYLNGALKYNLTSYGNNSNFSWQFTPNFTDESYGSYHNLTLIALNPIYSNLNFSMNWNANITHVNAPVNFSGHIADRESVYTQPITIDLGDYFSDSDYFDGHYNQTVNFSIISNSTPSYISSVFSGWVLNLSSLISTSELLTITGSDYNSSNSSLTNASSNSFIVDFTSPPAVNVPLPSAGGGGGASLPTVLKIILPEPVSAYAKQNISLPITISNEGKMVLYNIALGGIAAINNQLSKDFLISFSKQKISQLSPGEKVNVTMNVDINTEVPGLYELTIKGDVENPRFSDWAKLYLTVKEGNQSLAMEKIVFTEELVAENPRCIELMEAVDDAKKMYDAGDFEGSMEKSLEVVEACKYAISQQANPSIIESPEARAFVYVFWASLLALSIGICYYFYKRIALRKISRYDLRI